MFWACLGEMEASIRRELEAMERARAEARQERPGQQSMMSALENHEAMLARISGVPSPLSLN
jgi:hypothetical protein